MPKYRAKLATSCQCARKGCHYLFVAGERASRIGNQPVCDYCFSKLRNFAEQENLSLPRALEQIPAKGVARVRNERTPVQCARPGCDEILHEGEHRVKIGKLPVCSGCYCSAWHRARRENCSIERAFQELPSRREKARRKYQRPQTKCQRRGCKKILKQGERRVFIAERWPVCLTCHGAICRYAQQQKLSIEEAFHWIASRKRSVCSSCNEGETSRCARSGCLNPLATRKRRRIGQKFYCLSCAGEVAKLRRQLGISPSSALKQLGRKRARSTQTCGAYGCVRTVGNGVLRRVIGRNVYCRSCGNTIARMMKRLNISSSEARRKLKQIRSQK